MISHHAPPLEELPILGLQGCIIALLLHVGVSEPVFYLANRWFHSGSLFTHYHSIQHASPVPTPMTGKRQRQHNTVATAPFPDTFNGH